MCYDIIQCLHYILHMLSLIPIKLQICEKALLDYKLANINIENEIGLSTRQPKSR